MCKTLEYNKKTAHVSVESYAHKYDLSKVPTAGTSLEWPLTRENYAHKYNLTKVHTSCTPVNWPKDSEKYDLYINDEGMYDMGISVGDYDED